MPPRMSPVHRRAWGKLPPPESTYAAERRILLEGGDSIGYDIVAFNIGSTVANLDLPGVREHAVPTRPISRFVQRIDDLIEQARAHGAGSPFRVIVVGAGAGGVELAFTIQYRLAAETGRRIDVQLLDGAPRVMRHYPSSLIRRINRLAAARGIELLCDRRVAAAAAGAVMLSAGPRLACDVLVWVPRPTTAASCVSARRSRPRAMTTSSPAATAPR